MGHAPRCDCRSGGRSLVLMAANLVEEYPELSTFGAGADWEIVPELGAVRVELGTGRPLSGAGELVNFLRGVLDPGRLGALRAAWVTRGCRVQDQMASLLHAEPLLTMAPEDSSPLLEILESRRLETWYQPIARASDGALWGYECLMRGRSSDGELIYPDKLLAWGRQEKLIFMLDRLSRETHLRNAAVALAGSDVRLLLNFLPTAIYNPEFCLTTTVAAAKAGGFPADRIVFEVVETEEVRDLTHLRTILDYYRRSGFRVALDDIGSGYSGLAMLADLDPDLIKIDRALIARAVESPMHRSICATLTQLGRDHGKLVLAEGVETVEQRDLLGGLGVDLFQGYLFGRPSQSPQAPAWP